MKRKILLIVAVGLLMGADAPKHDAGTKEVETAIRALNKAFEKQDIEAIKALTTDDHVSITSYGGSQNKAEQLKDLPDLKITEYQDEDFKVTLITKGVALIRYRLTQKGAYRGKPLPSKSYATAVWVQRGGKWLETAYQETPVDGK
jgi:ketosteroid isomerase-like protein